MKTLLFALLLVSGSAGAVTQPTIDQHTMANPLPVKPGTGVSFSLTNQGSSPLPTGGVQGAGFTRTNQGATVLNPGALDFSRTNQGVQVLNTVDANVTNPGDFDFSRTNQGVTVINQVIVDLHGHGLTTGVDAPFGGARLNAAGTVYAQAMYPMGNWLAQGDCATTLVGTTAIPVAAYVAPSQTGHYVIRNNSATVTIFIGGFNTVTAANGFPLYPLEAWSQDATTNAPLLWWAIVPSGSADLRFCRW